jgi:hypothetical protein
MEKLLFDGCQSYFRGSNQKIISIRVNTERARMQALFRTLETDVAGTPIRQVHAEGEKP